MAHNKLASPQINLQAKSQATPQVNPQANSQANLQAQQKKPQLIIAAGIGTFLEFFDFTVYSFFAAVIGKVFFKSSEPLVAVLISVTIFSVGFVMRPLGSITIGAYADHYGRKTAMLITIVLMACGSALIGFAPTQATVGAVAPFFIIVGRLLQGFAAGGETGAAATLLMESSSRHTRGFFVSWQFVAQGLSALFGSLFAASLMALLTNQQMESWGWRVPFIFALLIIPVGLYIRAHIDETYEAPEPNKLSPKRRHPFAILLTRHSYQIILSTLLILPVTALIYIMVFYMPNYLKTVTKIASTHAFLISSYASIIMTIAALVSGFICDRLEQRKWVSILILVVALLCAYGTFYNVTSLAVFMIFYSIVIACLGLLMTTSVLMIMEAFEQPIRATAIATTYAFGVSIFGGTAQIIVTQLLRLSNGNAMAPFWYLGCALSISIIALLLFDEKRQAV